MKYFLERTYWNDNEDDDPPLIFENLKDAATYWLNRILQDEVPHFEKMISVYCSLFHPKYLGHPIVLQPVQKPDFDSILKVSLYVTADDQMTKLPDPPDDQDIDYWTAADAPGIDHCFDLFPFIRTNSSLSKSLAQIETRIKKVKDLHKETEAYREKHAFYFQKVEWYRRRQEAPPFDRLGNPFSTA